MKALELRTFPPLERPRLGYAIPAYQEKFRREKALIESKRLTDAELAAEYHSQDARCRHEQWIETVRGDDDYEDWERAMQSQMYDQLSILHRFATLPHYDEDQP